MISLRTSRATVTQCRRDGTAAARAVGLALIVGYGCSNGSEARTTEAERPETGATNATPLVTSTSVATLTSAPSTQTIENVPSSSLTDMPAGRWQHPSEAFSVVFDQGDVPTNFQSLVPVPDGEPWSFDWYTVSNSEGSKSATLVDDRDLNEKSEPDMDGALAASIAELSGELLSSVATSIEGRAAIEANFTVFNGGGSGSALVVSDDESLIVVQEVAFGNDELDGFIRSLDLVGVDR